MQAIPALLPLKVVACQSRASAVIWRKGTNNEFLHCKEVYNSLWSAGKKKDSFRKLVKLAQG